MRRNCAARRISYSAATISLLGLWLAKLTDCNANGWHEPYESRGSRTDLWGTGGEIPPVYPATTIRKTLISSLSYALEY
jgi:hypothetical protein